MFYTDELIEKNLINLFEALNSTNALLIDKMSSRESINRILITHFGQYLRDGDFKHIIKRLKVRHNIKRLPSDLTSQLDNRHDYNYFSDERIAIYYAVFGSYDTVKEPVFVPDNCDYYIVSDQKDSLNLNQWKLIDADMFLPGNSLSNAEKNRYFKMHPHILFPNYKYSIYLDSNIIPVNDLTPFVNMIDKHGMAFHAHRSRDCVYSEAKAVEMVDKLSKSEYREYLAYLEEIKMIKHYGLPECNIIAREHNNEECIQIMEEWWKCFSSSKIKRDQLWLPLVLKNHSINVNDITVLGNNVYKQPLVRIEFHN